MTSAVNTNKRHSDTSKSCAAESGRLRRPMVASYSAAAAGARSSLDARHGFSQGVEPEPPARNAFAGQNAPIGARAGTPREQPQHVARHCRAGARRESRARAIIGLEGGDRGESVGDRRRLAEQHVVDADAAVPATDRRRART